MNSTCSYPLAFGLILTAGVAFGGDKWPDTQPPEIGMAKVAGDHLDVTQKRFRAVYESRVRKIPISAVEDGKRVTRYVEQVYRVPRQITETVTRRYPSGTWTVHQAEDGKAVPWKSVSELLKVDQFVLISVDGQPVAEAFRKLYRPTTLIVVVPQILPTTLPASPVVPRGQPATVPVKPLPPGLTPVRPRESNPPQGTRDTPAGAAPETRSEPKLKPTAEKK